MARKGLSGRALATALGVSNATVSGWQKHSRPHASQAQAIAEFFGVQVEDLIDDSRYLPGQKPLWIAPAVAYAGVPQEVLAQQLRAQAAQLLAMAEQLEPMDQSKAETPKKNTDFSWMKPGRDLTPQEQETYRRLEAAVTARIAAERAEAKAELDDIIRTVDAAEDLPEIKRPVIRRRA